MKLPLVGKFAKNFTAASADSKKPSFTGAVTVPFNISAKNQQGQLSLAEKIAGL
ncbi:hypothetical protein DYBT9623_00688 [Dyadobacter sp. CECT 9623]|uniref:Uncharacterized protein n=1 Tax=Dyadobacter linearis TaxID=2823330 RepID=A0ABN7R1B2_9BACT|nr:hypothetical protein DYBT9623_00688 [Dyadobacter sp. CECT 9623]